MRSNPVKKMKIAILNTYTSGGAGIACARLVEALRRGGHQVSVLTAENKSQKPNVKTTMSYLRWRFNFTAERLSWWRQEANKEVRFAFSLGNWGKNASAQQAVNQADIIHLHWINHGFLSLENLNQLAKLNKPIVWTLHDLWAFTGGCHYSGSCENYTQNCGNCIFVKKPKPNDISFSIFEQKKAIYPNFKNLNIVTCSGWLADLARKSPLLKNATIQNIANPIDTQIFSPVNKQIAKQNLGLAPNKQIILFVAANISDKRKGFELLAESLNLLAQQYDKTKIALLIMGKADEEILKKLPFQVHYLGNLNKIEEIVQAYSAADVFAMPSLEDNLPNTIMESLACATPVVAFKVGGIPEMIIHQQTGYLADNQDVINLKNGLLWLLNYENKEKLNQAARQFVLDHYHFELINSAYTTIYQQAITK